MPTWLLSLNPKIWIGVGIFIAILLVGWVIFEAGKSSERGKGLQATIDAINERDEIDGKTKTLSDADLCTKLGGRWVSDNCE